MNAASDDLVEMSACALRDELAAGEVSARQVANAHIAQIDALDDVVNAVVTRTRDVAWADAARLDDTFARTHRVSGPLHGLPVVHKDLAETAGVRTTFGSTLFADYVPAADDLVVARMRAAGTVMLGKSNTPEFGAGSHTFNALFGVTRNPWDLERSAGGSSGGAAVALACRMAALADGSDLGGSLRNPTAFCGVVGLRPSIGRVPSIGPMATRARLGVAGPIARTVDDVALLLSAIAGPERRAPFARGEPGSDFEPPLLPISRALRVAFSADLGDLPVDRDVRSVIAAFLPTLTDLGWSVEAASPNFDGADRCFETIRAWYTAMRHHGWGDGRRAQLKSTIRAELGRGEALSAVALGEAFVAETRLTMAGEAFFDDYDLLVCPATQVPPFPVADEYVTEIDGVAMTSYIEWMRICSRLTVLGVPALSLPVGFTNDGLPVGIQIVGRAGSDLDVLRAGAMIEAALALPLRPPLQSLQLQPPPDRFVVHPRP